jgi:hypothetical protein
MFASSVEADVAVTSWSIVGIATSLFLCNYIHEWVGQLLLFR